jgi:hypothetical protein
MPIFKEFTRYRPVLWVNDAPKDLIGEHGHVYEQDRTFPVEVSFEAANGKWVRASFDPQTGEISSYTLKEAGAPCPE